MRSLIVEDEFTSRMQIKYFLEKYGPCDTVVNGSEAVKAFKMAIAARQPYDLYASTSSFRKRTAIRYWKRSERSRRTSTHSVRSPPRYS